MNTDEHGLHAKIMLISKKEINTKSLYEKQTINVETSIQSGTEHILLVDDEKAIIEMEQNMLERLGYKVTSRSSSLEALEAFRAAPDKFDLVISDMAMPNMSGDKLLFRPKNSDH